MVISFYKHHCNGTRFVWPCSHTLQLVDYNYELIPINMQLCSTHCSGAGSSGCMATIVSTGVIAVILTICVVVFTAMTIIFVKGKTKAQAEQAADSEVVEHYSSHSVIDTEMNVAYGHVHSVY